VRGWPHLFATGGAGRIAGRDPRSASRSSFASGVRTQGSARGLWNIPYPADGAEVYAKRRHCPLVGFDADCFRLGYGGGFFDRTLATLSPKPLAIGVGYPSAALSTIYPQPYDVAMDWVVAGSSAALRRVALRDSPGRPQIATVSN